MPRVQRAIRWRDGSEIDSAEMQIEDIERRVELLGGLGVSEKFVEEEAAKLPALRARLAELKATAKAA